MSTYPVDIKAKQITSTAANQEVFGGPGRFLGFLETAQQEQEQLL